MRRCGCASPAAGGAIRGQAPENTTSTLYASLPSSPTGTHAGPPSPIDASADAGVMQDAL